MGSGRGSILGRVPVRVRESVIEEGCVVVLVPRFNGWLGRWITQRLLNPCYRVRLDRFGSEVWNSVDGIRTVREIAEELRYRLGEEIEPAEERVAAFFRRLERGRCIELAKGRS